MEQPPEDEAPQREPYNEWLIDTLAEVQEEALKHFDRRLLHAVGSWIYKTYGDTLEGVRQLISILQKALSMHYRYGCRESRIGQEGGGCYPLRSFPRSDNPL
ncbi:vpr protein [Simian immunodeficiency virus SIV-mnd 2]|uniref:Protein Vpr n=1 Tax=Simian immunodeficiency virus SIV-mnd 2 TaxID=159122 RepID=Q8AII6_SIV|nr:vpr protein [Simian immunodeficiency virus SIV-mnd 2]AAN85710.1 vpr protein [Simian immunodeficiency virus SIV-mnd 2]